MQLKTWPLFYHPTTIVMVDDEATFLRSLITALNQGADCRGFVHPEAALQFLNAQSEEHILFSHENHDIRTVYLDSPETLAHFLETDTRFQFVSTVIVDYTMPTMDGLAFCRALKSPFIRKIMLTGHATLDIAIKAFNEGVIDKFFQKSDENILGLINDAVAMTQYEYFANRAERWLENWPNKEILPTWLHDSQVIQFLLTQIQKVQAVEFYTINEAGDILLLDAQGKKQILVFRDQAAMSRQQLQAEEVYQAEPDPKGLLLLEQLKKNEFIIEPLSQAQMNYSLQDWQPFVHPAKKVLLDQNEYFYAIIPENKSNINEYLGWTTIEVKPLDTFAGNFKVEEITFQ